MWDQVLDYVKPRVGSEVIETWFQPVILESVDGVQARISVPNKFFGEWLSRNYRDLISEAFTTVESLGPLQIDFVVRQRYQGSVSETERKPLTPTDSGTVSMRGRRISLPNPKYTFKNFVVGASNQFAHAASLAVAESPARAYNPLFIYGGVGLGKTHLLNSIGNYVAERGSH
jgi:chromosomal replication initiator protein